MESLYFLFSRLLLTFSLSLGCWIYVLHLLVLVLLVPVNGCIDSGYCHPGYVECYGPVRRSYEFLKTFTRYPGSLNLEKLLGSIFKVDLEYVHITH